MKKVCVIGLGYIGLPTASLLGTKGYEVLGVDVDTRVVETINRGEVHIVEPGLDILVRSAIQSGNLTAALEPAEADIFILAVSTPFKEGYQPDLSQVEAASRRIAPVLKPGNLVILESTSPVKTTEDVIAPILREAGHKVGEDVFVAHCPERVLPGRILTELVENDRIVGGINEASAEVAAEFYREFVSGEVLVTDAATAEFSKLAENTFRDVNIALANEISILCDREGINPWDVIALANRHPRVQILQPGPGVGGHCNALAPWFLVARAPEQARLIRTAREVNDGKIGWVVDKVKSCAGRFKRPVIACLGLAFKADIDDLRESPAVKIVNRLIAEDVGQIVVSEPNIKSHDRFTLIGYEEAVVQADIVLLLVDHREFKRLKAIDFKEKILIDTRGVVR
ncbi:MAG TPA: UDP-N-acetyl-D-mannosamine dehydrogenase [Kiloniellaceae bacterium]|nr:UDP-N-acetyl-D-mannosamine dehydrogenase [Kiloniellaceae bacterium]